MDRGAAVSIGELLEERRFLSDVAYWMLGSRSAAESVVDETYRRWYELSDTARGQITEPRSWLARITGGTCLARLSLPDGFDGAGSPAVPADEAQAAGYSAAASREAEITGVLLHALDCLPPAERAAFVFHDVFGMTPGAIAQIVGRTEPECAELAARARHSLRLRRSRPTTPEQHDRVARAVHRACVAEDVELLAALLSPDATAFFDGGGKVRALTRPVHGSRQVAQGLLTLLGRRPRTTLSTHSVNGRTGLVARYDRQVAAIVSFDIAHPHVVQVWVVLNPDKLQTWNHPDGGDASATGAEYP